MRLTSHAVQKAARIFDRSKQRLARVPPNKTQPQRQLELRISFRQRAYRGSDIAERPPDATVA